MEKNSGIEDLITSTYLELNKVRNEIDILKASSPFKHNIYAIEIALALFQLGYFNNRSIEKKEEYWFEGGYHIHYDFDGSWPKLADNYSTIVTIVRTRNFFR
jgi:hypothetical protein